ncbi:MAG: SCO family protein [Armatimonadota bacterium]
MRWLTGLAWLLLIFAMLALLLALWRRHDALVASSEALPILGTVQTDFTLTTQWGEKLSLSDLKGKVWVAYFFFSTCPSICPIMNQNMVAVQEAIREMPDVVIVGFTVDPETDTPEVLRRYGERFGVQRGKWYYLTGDKKLIYTVARQSFKLAAEPNPQPDTTHDFIHSEKFVLVDQQGRIRNYYTGTDKASVQQLIADIQRVAKE